VHGLLDFDIEFFSSLTFLVGINGSGKTTAVKGLSALLAPSLVMLADMRYDRMEVEIRHEGKELTILSTRDEAGIRLQTSETNKEELVVPTLPRLTYQVPHRRDQLIEFYREHEAANATHPVMQFLKQLPTPMFLNIERRFEELQEVRPSSVIRRRTHNVFSSSLATSLLQAAGLAEDHFRSIQAKQIELRDALREKFLLTTIQYQVAPTADNTAFPKLMPGYLDAKQAQIKSILVSLGLDEQETSNQLEPFFQKYKYMECSI
jgi:predicted ATP-binding protein involved in virulence